ncbi:DUF397 domain-containing protein [Streptomyces sp. NPDC058274]
MVSGNRTIPDASALTGWRKSSYSGGGNGDCLEVIVGQGAVRGKFPV